METTSCRRGDFSPILESHPAEKIDRNPREPGGPRPTSTRPIQTRAGFLANQALATITGGKDKGPTKLKTMSAQGLAVKSADHLAVKSADHLKK